jgi:hypothetical protein
MITPAEEAFIAEHAYVPEHLPGYVTAVSPSEPYLVGDYLCYRGEGALVFIGYPLRSPFDEHAMVEAFRAALSRFKPTAVALTAPAISALQESCRARGSDHYYRLHLSKPALHAKLRSTIRRASRELRVESARRTEEEHARLISEFLGSRPFTEETRYIFERIPAYVSSASTARVFSARGRDGNLVAFDVADFGAGEYAFYQFNFLSRKHYVPGASDLLLHEVIQAARGQGKSFLNLGLGINEGITRFKKKWGGSLFLPYEFCRDRPGPPKALDLLLQRL